jgi:hypothetical protein
MSKERFCDVCNAKIQIIGWHSGYYKIPYKDYLFGKRLDVCPNCWAKIQMYIKSQVKQ